jgi:putative acetyltransferase
MFSVLRTDSSHPHFGMLVSQLNAYLSVVNGDKDAFYSQYNQIDVLKNVILVYNEDMPVGCGAVKEAAPGVMEVKRMFTLPAFRGTGVATRVLLELERWSAELGNRKCILETGRFMPDAVALYSNRGYRQIPNYGPYADTEDSICFEKEIQ